MTPYFSPFRSTTKALYSTLALAVAAFSLPVHAQDPAIVGEATMVIGVASVIGSDGVTRGVDRGTAIRVGDRVQTQSGGHVHLRFVDGGRLSIRPSSSLHVEDYSHSQQQPALGAIKFRLEEGVVRSITGSWGEAARERFRLNTPVAAIGVKGTDFVVKTEGDKTSASVYTGAIALTPLVGACSQSVGPCLNGFEKILSEDMKGQMVELSRREVTPQLVPLIDLLARSTRASTPSASNDAASTRHDKTLAMDDTQNESRITKTVVINNQAASLTSTPAVIAAATPVVIAAATPVVIAAATPVVIAAATPVVGPPQVNQLIWSRYIWVQTMAGDTFTRSLGEALAVANYDRLPGNGTYLLFRPTGASGEALTTPDAIANFRLGNSTAQLAFASGLPSESVNVNDGTLSVDFTRSTFATRLALSSQTIGRDAIVASGSITPSGVLQATNSNAAINGALSLDGKEAGYAFVKAVATGNLRGVTLWGR
jgi:hypothetical protein